MSRISLYADPRDLSIERRPYLADILRPFYNDRNREENEAIYGREFFQHYEWEHDPSKADVFVLPYGYHYLIRSGKDIVRKYFTLSEKAGKKILVWNTGDFSYSIDQRNAIDVRTNAYRSKMKSNQVVMPVFIRDPFVEYADLRKDIAWSEKPVVGFVGQAVRGWRNMAYVFMTGAWSHAAYRTGFNSREPNVLWSPQRLRWDVLNVLERSEAVETRFLRREKYRAGVAEQNAMQDARRQFYANMFDTQYTVCLRGGGNFSVRFYETLACGRIPLYIDTDSVLPASNVIEWDDVVLAIPQHEAQNTPARLSKFHNNLASESNLQARSQLCRSLWEQYCTFTGFFSYLHRVLSSD